MTVKDDLILQSISLVVCPVLLRRFSYDHPESFRKMAGRSKVELIRNLVDGGVGGGEHQLRSLHPDEPNIAADGNAHFLLEFPGEVVFGVTHLLCQSRELQFLFRVKLDVVTAKPDLCGNRRTCAVLPDPEDKVLVHRQIQGGQLRKGPALAHTFYVSFSNRKSRIHGDAGGDGFPDTQGGKTGGFRDCSRQ